VSGSCRADGARTLRPSGARIIIVDPAGQYKSDSMDAGAGRGGSFHALREDTPGNHASVRARFGLTLIARGPNGVDILTFRRPGTPGRNAALPAA